MTFFRSGSHVAAVAEGPRGREGIGPKLSNKHVKNITYFDLSDTDPDPFECGGGLTSLFYR